MQGRERSKEMSKSETGLQSLSQGSRERVWNGVKCWNSNSMGRGGTSRKDWS